MHFSKLFLLMALSALLNNGACSMQDQKNEKKTYNNEASQELICTAFDLNLNLDRIRFLLENNANPNVKNNYGYTPLHQAASKGTNEFSQILVQLLLNKGADVNAKNDAWNTPLHGAALYKNKECVKLLLDKNADINTKNNTGETPLHVAITTNDTELVQLLLDRGADMRAKDRYGCTPLHKAARQSKELTQLLLTRIKALANNLSSEHVKYFVHNKKFNQQSLTFLLCLKKNHEQTGLKIPKFIIFEILFFAYSSFLEDWINAPNEDGETALDVAIQENNNEVTEVIKNFKEENNLN